MVTNTVLVLVLIRSFSRIDPISHPTKQIHVCGCTYTDGRLLKHDEKKNFQAHTKVTRDKDTKYNFISFKKLYSNAYGDLEAISSFAKKAHVEYENAIYAVHDLCGKI